MSVKQLSESTSARNFLGAIVRNSIQDYQALVRAGVIKDGKQVKSIKTKRWGVRGMTTDQAVRELIAWWDEEYLEELVEMGDLRLPVGTIRERLEEIV